MKNEEISQKPMTQSHSAGSEAYANMARSAWEKPSSGASKADSTSGTSGSDRGGQFAPQSGSNDLVGHGTTGKPGGGGGHRIEQNGDSHQPAGSSAAHRATDKNEGVDAQGNSAHEKAGAVKGQNTDGVGAFGKPSDKGSEPTENKNKAGGESMHSTPKERVDKQDAAAKFLPSLSIA